ncbi:Signal transduction histidine kinase [Azospirillum oryzae]|uniref:histidine kinase n=1 Tax=Azospirillum oryzae TaxID=286727 RepID=A0A1X7HP75_9PROT|nr:ATP-binding protein [Azospirillum oryzae]SMF90185.1 Signal transduction histidine kinase [Azospirillum oryzae]
MTPLLRHLVPRTLFTQMVLLLAAAVVVAKLGSWYAYMDERAFAMQQLRVEDTITRTAAAIRLIAAAPNPLHKDALEAVSSGEFRLWWDREQIGASVTPTGEALAARDRLKAQVGDAVREIRVLIRRPGGTALAAPDGSEQLKLMVSALFPDGRWLNAATVQPARPAVSNGSLYFSILTSVAMVALVAFFISCRISRPLKQIGEAAERLGRGEAVELDERTGPDEVRRAATAFNAMGARLRRFVDDRTRMLAAVSHDLRTPITNLRLRVELLEEDETKQRMLDNVEELRLTAEAMLSFAREEGGEQARAVDLVSLVESVCEDMADVGAPVTFDGGAKLPVVCRPIAMRRVVRNLVENAIAYGTEARVTVCPDGGDIRVTVEDRGPGIPALDIERVFEPFVRLEASRNRSTGGAGLGLSIARSIVRGHGGDIRLENRPDGGLRAVLTLPAMHIGDDREGRRTPARQIAVWGHSAEKRI